MATRRAITFQFTGAGTQSYVVPTDCLYIGGISTSGTGGVKASVSTDPALTAAVLAAPTAQQIIDTPIDYLSCSTNPIMGGNSVEKNIFLPLGTKLYVNASAADSAIIYLEDILPS